MVEILWPAKSPPHGGAQQLFGNQLGRGRRCGRLASGTGASLCDNADAESRGDAPSRRSRSARNLSVSVISPAAGRSRASAFLFRKFDQCVFGRQMAEVGARFGPFCFFFGPPCAPADPRPRSPADDWNDLGGLLFGFLPEELLLQRRFSPQDARFPAQDGDSLDRAACMPFQ